MNDQRVLVFDVETTPLIAYVWDVKDQYINANQIMADWKVMAFSAKWLNAPVNSICYRDIRKTPEKLLLKSIWELLNEADIVVTQNGEKFDCPKLNARFIYYGMRPPSPYKHLDTYKIAKKIAAFTSHSLEYLTDKLCTKYKKLSHSKFPGLSLWKECLKGNNEAWDEMKKYNIHDVLSTEELYHKLKPWTPQSMAKVYVNGSCEVCGSKKLQKRGQMVKNRLFYQRYQCQSCGKWSIGEKIK